MCGWRSLFIRAAALPTQGGEAMAFMAVCPTQLPTCHGFKRGCVRVNVAPAQTRSTCSALPSRAQQLRHSASSSRSSRSVVVYAGKAAAAAAAAAPVAAGAPLWPAVQQAITPVAPYLLAIAACFCTLNILMMALLPRATATLSLSRSSAPYLLLAAAYAALLAASWQTDTLALMMPGSLAEGLSGFKPQFFPHLGDIQALFNRTGLTAASFLAHILAINLFAARALYLDGGRSRVRTAHSILLCAVLGPLGLLCHLVTKVWYAVLGRLAGRDLRPASPALVERTREGTITIMPYD